MRAIVVHVGRGDRDHDRADWVVLVGGLMTLKAETVRFAEAPQVFVGPFSGDHGSSPHLPPTRRTWIRRGMMCLALKIRPLCY
jgi:hypothetical protein